MKRAIREHRLDAEIWKIIPGTPGFEASNLGNIKSPTKGVLQVNPRTRVKIGVKRSIAYWVLLAFKGPPPLPYGTGANRSLARHLDDDQTNNRLSNLAWGTPSDNRYDAIRNGRLTYSPERNAKISAAMKGNTHNTGRRFTASHRAKIAAALKGNKNGQRYGRV